METQILEELGLTKNEINIFIILVQNGLLSVTNIAKKTGLNRPYVYYALERLLEKGYISEIKKSGKKHYKNINLDELITSEHQKIELFESFVTELKKRQKVINEETEVEVLKGKYVVKNIFKKCMNKIQPKEEFLAIGIDESIMESIEPVYLKKILNFFAKNNIKEKIIIKEKGKKLDYAKTTRYKYIEPQLIENTAKIIFQDIVIELLYGNPTYAIIIKSKQLAKTAKKQFQIFWKTAHR